MSDRTDEIVKAFAAQDSCQCESGMAKIAGLSNLTTDEKIKIASALGAMFYRDERGNTALTKLIKEAESMIASFGPDVIDWIIGQFDEADAESAEHLAKSLGLIGTEAVDKTRTAFTSYKNNPYILINLLSAVGHFNDPSSVKLLPEVLEHAKTDEVQVKSAAFYCLGRLCNRLPAGTLADDEKTAMFDSLFSGLSHPKALVRRHAVRALGKMAVNSYLTAEQSAKVNKAFRAILGMDDYEWDDAYIVRTEAEYYLSHSLHSENTGG
ncbi:hypothetical protein MNBD_NITROSPINAE01-554 [hydrothermal vent metagenome]|uniref:Uncharacterized protein n=1 Tax=hydrothermal vent metagenome TaxID=652676 RepID=A0A3B1BRR6_9ZZZZ